jgi:hypothetical protein
VSAAAAAVAADPQQQDRRAPPERCVREPPLHRVEPPAPTAAAAALVAGIHDDALQHRTVGLEQLPNDPQAELAEAAERGQVRRIEGSVEHVEVFRTDGVRTPIIGRPRPLQPATRHTPVATTVNKRRTAAKSWTDTDATVSDLHPADGHPHSTVICEEPVNAGSSTSGRRTTTCNWSC